jgi:GNAT superfamily N-acetyltransferase
MRIEKAELKHLPSLGAVFNDYRVHFNQPSDPEKSRAFIEERIRDKTAVVFLAIDDETGDCMGFTLLYPVFSSLKTSRIWTLNDMYIAEKYRKFGLATKLLERVKELAVESDAAWIMLKTGEENLKAQALYEKFGFVKDREHCYYYLQNPSG